MMTIVGILMLCFTRLVDLTRPSLMIFLVAIGMVAFVFAYFSRLNRPLAALLSLYLISQLWTSGSQHSTDSALTWLCLAIAVVITAGALTRENYRVGIVVGLVIGLLFGRSLMMAAPWTRGIFWSTSSATLFFAYLMPLLLGGLVGMDISALAERWSDPWNSRLFRIAAGALALLCIGLRVADVASGNYLGYTPGELETMGKTGALIRRAQAAPSETERCLVLRSLWHIGGAEADQAILGRLRDPNAKVREEAVLYFRSPAMLAQAMQNDYANVRSVAVRKLIDHAPDQAFDILVSCLDNPQTRRESIDGLSRLGDKRAVPRLLLLLSADDESASAALYAVGALQDKTALPYVLKVLHDDRPDLWRTAFYVADKLGGHTSASAELVKHTGYVDSYGSRPALDAFRYYGDESDVVLLQDAAQKCSDKSLCEKIGQAEQEIQRRLKERRN